MKSTTTIYTNLFLVSSLSTTTPALAALRGFLNHERTISSFSEKAHHRNLDAVPEEDHYEESGECGVVCSVVPYEKDILSCRTVGGSVCGATNQRNLIADAVAHPDFGFTTRQLQDNNS